MNIKKVLAVTSAILMMTTLIGCTAETENSTNSGKVETSQNSENKVTKENNKKDENEEAEVTAKSTPEEKNEADETKEQVVYDENDVLIVYTGIEQDDILTDAKFNFRIENNSEKALTISSDNVSVNGYTISGMVYEEIAAGKKVNTSIELYDYEMEENGISTINYIEFIFKCIDSETYSTVFETDITKITINEGTETENTANENSELLFEQDGISVYYSGLDESDWLSDYNLKFQIVNNSENNVVVSTDNCSVNDFSMSLASFYSEVASGKKTNDTLCIYSSELEENGIDKPEKLEFSLKCLNSDTYDTIWETEPIVITIK